MNAFTALINSQNQVTKMVSSNNPDLNIYYTMGYEAIKTGTKNVCHEAIVEYWDENDIPEDNQLYTIN